MIKLLTIAIGTGLVIASIGTFLGLNYYENVNNCSLHGIPEFPFFECRQLGIGGGWNHGHATVKKPLILLYPEEDISVKVQLEYAPGLFAEYPEYSSLIGGWEGRVTPESIFTPIGSSYPTYGIFWEGNPSLHDWNMSDGFVVSGADIREFLEEKLDILGLNTKERSDFIMFWYPKLQNHKYVQIRFAGEDYANLAKLDISPTPDSLLRVFMIAKLLNAPIDIPPQVFPKFERNGFTVVEWGGTIIPE